MTEERNCLATLVEDYGFTKDEARIFAHLTEAQRLYAEMPEARFNDQTFRNGIQDAFNVLALHVVRREHPEGWRTGRDDEDESGE